MVELGDFRFWDGGDLTQNTEARLVTPVNRVGTVDVYQVNHHGLDYSNNAVFIQSLADCIGDEQRRDQGLRWRRLCAALKSANLKAMYQVHKNLRADIENNTGDAFIANLTKDCDAHHIHMSVAPDGKSYSINIPDRGQSNIQDSQKINRHSTAGLHDPPRSPHHDPASPRGVTTLWPLHESHFGAARSTSPAWPRRGMRWTRLLARAWPSSSTPPIRRKLFLHPTARRRLILLSRGRLGQPTIWQTHRHHTDRTSRRARLHRLACGAGP